MEAAKAEESPALVAELSIQTLRLLSRLFISLSTLSSHPLFAILAAASLLAVYIPRPLLPLLLSPVPISTFLLLAALLRLGSPPSKSPVAASAAAASDDGEGEELTPLRPESKPEANVESDSHHQKAIFSHAFVDCSRLSGPLEVIYEEYEGEEKEECGGGGSQEYRRWPQNASLGKGTLAPLGFTYTDPDTESDGDGSPAASEGEGSSSPEEERWLRWAEEEEEGDDMIEIELEEEENLIEIDIFGGL